MLCFVKNHLLYLYSYVHNLVQNRCKNNSSFFWKEVVTYRIFEVEKSQ